MGCSVLNDRQGLLAWIAALLDLGLSNLTPLCVGQNNSDGNNERGICLLVTALSGILYMRIYLMVLSVSSLIGG
jgi:hypothetical protein